MKPNGNIYYYKTTFADENLKEVHGNSNPSLSNYYTIVKGEITGETFNEPMSGYFAHFEIPPGRLQF
jgi:hypothetical protein